MYRRKTSGPGSENKASAGVVKNNDLGLGGPSHRMKTNYSQ